MGTLYQFKSAGMVSNMTKSMKKQELKATPRSSLCSVLYTKSVFCPQSNFETEQNILAQSVTYCSTQDYLVAPFTPSVANSGTAFLTPNLLPRITN